MSNCSRLESCWWIPFDLRRCFNPESTILFFFPKFNFGAFASFYFSLPALICRVLLSELLPPFCQVHLLVFSSAFQSANTFLLWMVDILDAYHPSPQVRAEQALWLVTLCLTCYLSCLKDLSPSEFLQCYAGISTCKVSQDSWNRHVVYKDNSLFLQVHFALLLTFSQLEDIYFLSDPEVRTVLPCIFFACLQAHFSAWPSSVFKITLQSLQENSGAPTVFSTQFTAFAAKR